MSDIKQPEKAVLFCSVLYNAGLVWQEIAEVLEQEWGKFRLEYGPFPFSHTDYYTEEMGQPLQRKIVFFEGLVSLEDVYRHKHISNNLEKKFAVAGRRRVNIDPGYMTLSKVCLLTTKNYSHRIYLQKGIYAEVTLFFKGGHWQAYPWTYPDYAGEQLKEVFDDARKRLRTEIK